MSIHLLQLQENHGIVHAAVADSKQAASSTAIEQILRSSVRHPILPLAHDTYLSATCDLLESAASTGSSRRTSPTLLASSRHVSPTLLCWVGSRRPVSLPSLMPDSHLRCLITRKPHMLIFTVNYNTRSDHCRHSTCHCHYPVHHPHGFGPANQRSREVQIAWFSQTSPLLCCHCGCSKSAVSPLPPQWTHCSRYHSCCTRQGGAF